MMLQKYCRVMVLAARSSGNILDPHIYNPTEILLPLPVSGETCINLSVKIKFYTYQGMR
jgi:hypothetical protein